MRSTKPSSLFLYTQSSHRLPLSPSHSSTWTARLAKATRSGQTMKFRFWWVEESASHPSPPSLKTWSSNPASSPGISVKRCLKFFSSNICLFICQFVWLSVSLFIFRFTSSGWRGRSGSSSGCRTSSGRWRRWTRRSWSQFTPTSPRWLRSLTSAPPCWWGHFAQFKQ